MEIIMTTEQNLPQQPKSSTTTNIKTIIQGTTVVKDKF
jgi:hypothetical protein